MGNSTPFPDSPVVTISEEEIEEELEERPAGTGSLIVDLLRSLRREVQEVKNGVGAVNQKVDKVQQQVEDVEKKVCLLTDAYREHTRQLGVLTSNCLSRSENCPAIGTGEFKAAKPSPTF
jgi:hypothetical protein